jgi:hypothetical protein
MHVAAISTDTPIQHLQRALDELARMGMTLVALQVMPGFGSADIRIEFDCADPFLAENYRARLTRMPGVRHCSHDRAGADRADAGGSPTEVAGGWCRA